MRQGDLVGLLKGIKASVDWERDELVQRVLDEFARLRRVEEALALAMFELGGLAYEHHAIRQDAQAIVGKVHEKCKGTT